jgi:hypothetical protein
MTNHARYRAAALAFATLLWVGWAYADPPARVARLGYAEGEVSLSPAGETDWVQASLNQPLTSGDHLWTDSNARAELQLGGTAIRLGARSDLRLLKLDDSIAQLQLSEGSVRLHVRSIGSRQTVEVDTPNLALVLTRAGDYRVDVDPDGNATTVRVQGGAAEAYGEGASYRIGSNQAYRFYGSALADYEALPGAPDDALDLWAQQRERRIDTSPSARYVSADVVGYEDLDANGSWRVDASYGNVWTPNRVASGWTPYRDGHWAWMDPWGWTWMDDAPWGYAVSHYGRWARIRDTWSWVPGPQREAAVYAPALVVFLGGSNFRGAAGGGNVGWFPLAPREVYRPSYPVSRGYFDRVNHSNAVIAPGTVTTIYNQVNNTRISNTSKVVNVSKIVYVNQQVNGAVVAVPAQTFVQSRPVAKAIVPMAHELVRSAPTAALTVVARPAQNAHAGAPEAHGKPPQERHPVLTRTAPPVAQAAPDKPALQVQALPPKAVVAAPAPRPAPPPSAADTRRQPAQRTPPPRPDDSAQKAQALRADVVKAEAVRAEAAKAEQRAAKAEAGRNAQVEQQAVKAQAQAQANREKSARPGPAEPGARNQPAAPRRQGSGLKGGRESQTEEELRRAEEAGRKH